MRGPPPQTGSWPAWNFKKSGFTALVKPPVACFVRFPSADQGSVPVTWYTAMQPFESTPPPDVQIAGTDCPVKALLAMGT